MVVFENEENQIYKILSKTARDRNTLNELNALLNTERDSIRDDLNGLLLHYLAETAQANDE